MTLYCIFTKNPLAVEIKGNTRLKIIKASPEYIKKVIKGEMMEVAIIPIGQKQPNTFKDIGAVKICADVDDDKDIVKYDGKKRTYSLVKSLLNIKIPASAA